MCCSSIASPRRATHTRVLQSLCGSRGSSDAQFDGRAHQDATIENQPLPLALPHPSPAWVQWEKSQQANCNHRSEAELCNKSLQPATARRGKTSGKAAQHNKAGIFYARFSRGRGNREREGSEGQRVAVRGSFHSFVHLMTMMPVRLSRLFGRQ